MPVIPWPIAWLMFRALLGFVFAGLYAVIEAWINAKATNARIKRYSTRPWPCSSTCKRVSQRNAKVVITIALAVKAIGQQVVASVGAMPATMMV